MPSSTSTTTMPSTTSSSSVSSVSSSTTTRKSVQFNHRIRVRTVKRLDQALWYNANEVRQFQYHDSCLVHLINQQMITPQLAIDTEYCTRGLEGRTVSGLRKKRRNRQRAYAAVFEEQEDQQTEKVSDPEYLADIYEAFSTGAVKEAHRLAVDDEKYVKRTTSTPIVDGTDKASTRTVSPRNGLKVSHVTSSSNRTRRTAAASKNSIAGQAA